MKKIMNNEQIDELNKLLVNHADCLTAFFDEGVSLGMKRGKELFVVGALVASLASVGTVIVTNILKTKKQNKEEES